MPPNFYKIGVIFVTIILHCKFKKINISELNRSKTVGIAKFKFVNRRAVANVYVYSDCSKKIFELLYPTVYRFSLPSNNISHNN